MDKEFERTLDECIKRILLEDARVEDCLASYPEQARELEPQLRVVARTAKAYHYSPSRVNKERGRRSLRAERLKIEREKAMSRSAPSFRRLFSGFRPRWAITALSIIMALLLGGIGTVAASASSIPGQPLYVVKRTAEQVRLTLEPSPEGKAELHLVFTERRAQEAVALAIKGDIEHLESLEIDVNNNLAAASRITATIKDPQALEGLKAKLEVSSSRALGSLQSVVQEAPEQVRSAAEKSFRSSGEAYGEAVERIAALSRGPSLAVSPGLLQLWAMDPPPPGIDKLLIEISEIEAHLVSGQESLWITIIQGPQTLDLARLSEVQKFLGEQKVRPGAYTRIRFRITRATAVSGGVEHEVKMPGGYLNLARPFHVEENKTTKVVLDFDADRSLIVTGTGEFTLRPVVRVLAYEPRKEEERKAEKEERKERGRPPEKEEKKPEATPLATPPPVRVELEGTVDELTSTSLVLLGRTVTLSSETRIDGTLKKGQTVKVEALVQPDGTIKAARIDIKSEPAKEEEKKKEGPDERPSPGDSSGKRPSVRLTGAIESISPAMWKVKGREVLISPDTRIEGAPAAGFQVEIEGVSQPDDKILAISIKIKDIKPEPKQEERERPRETPGRPAPTPEPARKGGPGRDGRPPTPAPTPTPSPLPAPTITIPPPPVGPSPSLLPQPSPGPTPPAIPAPSRPGKAR